MYEWLFNRNCPHCGDRLYADYILPELEPYQIDIWQDFATWYLICTRCGIRFSDDDGELVEIA